MSKLKKKKAAKAARRAGKVVVRRVAGGIAKVAEAMVVVAGLVQQLADQRSGSSGDNEPRRRAPNPDA